MAPSSIEINKESVTAAMSQGQDSVRELIRGPKQTPYQREEQIKRLHDAMSLLQTELAGASKEQKMLVINVSKEALRGLHDDISADLQKGADQKLYELRRRVERIQSATETEERKVTPFLSKRGLEMEKESVMQSIKQRDPVKLATMGVGALGVAWLVKKLYDATIGSKQNPGFMRKAMGWLTALGAGALAALGLSRWLRSGDPLGKYGNFTDETLHGVKDGGDESLKNLKERIIKPYQEGKYILMVAGPFLYVYDQTGSLITKMKSEVMSLIQGDVKNFFYVHGQGMAVYGASWGAISGFRTLYKTGCYKQALGKVAVDSIVWEWKLVKNAATTAYGHFGADGRLYWKTMMGSSSTEHLEKLVDRAKMHKTFARSPKKYLWGEWVGTKAYHEAQLADRMEDIKIVLLRMQKEVPAGEMHPLIEKIFGEDVAKQVVECSQKGTRNITSITEGVLEHSAFLTEKGMEEIGSLAQKLAQGTPIADLMKEGVSLQDILRAAETMEEAKHLALLKSLVQEGKVTELIEAGARMDLLLKTGADTKSIVSACGKLDDLGRANVLEALIKQNVQVEELLASGAKHADILRAGGDANKLRAAGATAEDFVKAGKNAAEWKAVGGAADEFTKAEKAAADAYAKSIPKGPAAAPGAKVAAEGAEATKAVRGKLLALGANAEDAKIIQVLREGGAAESVITKLERSPGAMRLYKGAIATGQEAEVGKVMSMANKASKAAIPLRMLGVGADIFAAYMAYEDLMENELKIDLVKKTGNRELQALYETTRIIHGTNLGVNTVAVVVGGLAFVSGVAATASVVLIPVALAISVGVEGWKQVESIAADVYGTYKEYLHLTPANVLVKLREKSEGDPRSLGSALVSMAAWSDQSDIGRNAANFQIPELCKAYLIQTSRLSPAVGETKEAFKARYDTYIIDAMQYLGRSGVKSLDAEVFAKARIYADLCAKARQAQSLNQPYNIAGGYLLSSFEANADEDKNATNERWKQRMAAVEQTYNARHEELADTFNMLKEGTQNRKELATKTRMQDMLLASVEDDVNFLRRRLEEQDYTDIGPGDNLHKRTAVVMASRMLRTELRNQSEVLFSQPNKLRYEDVLAAQAKIRDILHREPMFFQNEGIRAGLPMQLQMITSEKFTGWSKDTDEAAQKVQNVISRLINQWQTASGSEGLEELEMSWLQEHPMWYKHENKPLEQNEQLSMGTKLLELKGGVKQSDGSYLFQGEGESMSVKLNGSTWAWSDTKSNTWQPAGTGLYENNHSSQSPKSKAQRTEWNRIGIILKSINEKHGQAFWLVEKEVMNADTKRGTTIDQPLEVQLWGKKSSTPLIRRGPELYFRLPFPDLQWNVVLSDGSMSENRVLNQSRQYYAEGCVTDPRATKIRFWLPSHPQNVYEVPIQTAA